MEQEQNKPIIPNVPPTTNEPVPVVTSAPLAPVTPAAAASTQTLPGTGALLRQTADFYKAHSNLLIKIGLVIAAYNVLMSIIFTIFFAAGAESSMSMVLPLGIYGLVSTLVAFVLGFLYQVALLKSFAEPEVVKTMSLKQVYNLGFKFILPLIWVQILATLCVLGLTVFLVIPGIILSFYLFFSMYEMFYENTRGTRALAQSFHYVKDNFFKILGRLFLGVLVLIGIQIVVYLVGLLVGLIGPIVMTIPAEGARAAKDITLGALIYGYLQIFINYCLIAPISGFYLYALYKGLRSLKAPLTEEGLEKGKTKFVIMSVWGIIAGILLFSIIPIIFFTLNSIRKDGLNKQLHVTASQTPINLEVETTN